MDENAQRLASFMDHATRFVQLQRGDYSPIKFDVVAHSMGGLVLRWFLQYGARLAPLDGTLPRADWAGAASVATAIIIGTPSAGSLFALDRLTSGIGKNPVHPELDATAAGTFPSVYQLLPRTRHARFVEPSGEVPDLFEVEPWMRLGWGLADPNRDRERALHLPGTDTEKKRQAVAIEHLDKCLRHARAVHSALDRQTEPPDDLALHLILSDAKATADLATVGRGGQFEILRRAPGDGTVTRASALLDERVGGAWQARLCSPLRWQSVTFLGGSHLGLMRDPVCIDNVLYHLLEAPG